MSSSATPQLFEGSKQVLSFPDLAAAGTGRKNYAAVLCRSGDCCSDTLNDCSGVCCEQANDKYLELVTSAAPNVDAGLKPEQLGLTQGSYRLCFGINLYNPFDINDFTAYETAVEVSAANLPPPSPPPTSPAVPPSQPPPSSPSPQPPPSPPPSPLPDYDLASNDDGLSTCVDFSGPPSPPSNNTHPPPSPPPLGQTPPSAPGADAQAGRNCLTVAGLIAIIVSSFFLLLCCCACCIKCWRWRSQGAPSHKLRSLHPKSPPSPALSARPSTTSQSARCDDQRAWPQALGSAR